MKTQPLIQHLLPMARRLRSEHLAEGRDPSLLFNATVEAAFLVATADGHIDEEELTLLKAAVLALSEDLITRSEIDDLIEDFVELRSREGASARATAVGQMLKEQRGAAPGVKLASALAYVSGGLDYRELHVLEQVAEAAGLTADALQLITLDMRHKVLVDAKD